MKDFDPAILQPGDCLLYERTPWKVSKLSFLIGLVINIKTWSRFCHCEVYRGGGTSLASRDGIGVDQYKLRTAQLAKVRRPYPGSYDHEAAKAWFLTVKGQKYDWQGLLCFTYARIQGALDRMFCSEYMRRHYRDGGGLELFNPAIDSDRVAPAQMDQTPRLFDVWELAKN